MLPGARFQLCLLLLCACVIGGSNRRAPGRAAPDAPTPTGPIVELTGGADHLCARRAQGSVQCWGSNTHGQLGDGTRDDRPAAVTVRGLNDAEQIVAGAGFTCARRRSGTVACWGRNDRGQLGNGTAATPPGPPGSLVQVRGLSDVIELAAGASHVCALGRGGSLACWGDNAQGQLGTVGRAFFPAPVPVQGLGALTALAAGDAHTCALRAQGSALCWGDNRHGQLGIVGPGGHRPRAIAGSDDAQQLAAGAHHTCLLRSDGTAACWGDPTAGALDGTPQPRGGERLRPVPIPTGGAGEVRAGAMHTCARTRTGQVACWGNNDEGRLGDGTTDAHAGVVVVPRLSNVRTLAVAAATSCALTDAGKVLCWGSNRGGALGSGDAGPQPGAFATQVADPIGTDLQVDALVAGDEFSCALAGGHVACWGSNESGQIGDGTTRDAPRPERIAGLTHMVGLAAGWDHACALSQRGTVHCWGAGSRGQLGDGGRSNRRRPAAVPGITDGVEVAAGRAHTCVRRRGGTVVCFGDAEFGQTGAAASTTPSLTPVTVAGLGDPRALALGGTHSCAIVGSGAIRCWGRNNFGQLGDGAGARDLGLVHSTPVTVARVSDAVDIAAGDLHTCALRRTHTAVCWGDNEWGQLGGGVTTGWTTRIPVKTLTAAVALSSGPRHVCAVGATGQVNCWGDNADGQLGPAGVTLARQPVPLPGITEGVRIAAGGRHSCVARRAGGVLCWGDGASGQLGASTTDFRPSPGFVAGL